MKGPSVSIIIPVYNVKSYLENCLKSIRFQTFGDFEVLLIDDGSTDGSRELCRRYTALDARFRLLEQENAGASAARNLGMEHARGRYLQFVDGDDWLTPDATGMFLHAAEATGADMVVSHFYRVSGERYAARGHIKTACVMTRAEYAQHMVKAPANYYYGVMWNKMYRRAIVEAHHLRCPENVDWCEDFLFNLDYIASCRLIASVPVPLYYYLKRQDSLVNTQATLRRTIATKRMTFNEYKELYRQLDLYESKKAQVYRYLISSAGDGTVGLLSPSLGRVEEKKFAFGPDISLHEEK